MPGLGDKGLIGRARRLVRKWRSPGPDPFATLELQTHLTRLSAELRDLQRERVPRFAIHHHAEAATRAYEMTLADACRLIGIPPAEGRDRDARILLMEAELVGAGWAW